MSAENGTGTRKVISGATLELEPDFEKQHKVTDTGVTHQLIVTIQSSAHRLSVKQAAWFQEPREAGRWLPNLDWPSLSYPDTLGRRWAFGQRARISPLLIM